jgi:hypothetical protein
MFRRNDIMPNMICNEPPKPKRSSTRMYSRGAKKIDEMEGNIYLFHTVEGYVQLIFGWDIKAVKLDSSGTKIMTLCFTEIIKHLDLDYFIDSIEKITEISEFGCGMGYSRPIEHGPDLYAYGMIAGLEGTADERLERRRITAWLHDRIGSKRYLSGYLRDVYPMNILSEKHLLREVDGQLLPEWIASDAARGTIRKIGIANWLWTVPNESLPNMQAILRSQGLTIVPPDPETSS